MPRYFFDFHNGTDTPDADGTELKDIAQAKIEAARYASALLDDDPARFWSGSDWIMRVRDENGLQLFELTISSIDWTSLYDSGSEPNKCS